MMTVGRIIKPEHFDLMPSRLVFSCIRDHVTALMDGKVTEPISYDAIKLHIASVCRKEKGLSGEDIVYVERFVDSLQQFDTDSPQVTADWIVDYSNKKALDTTIRNSIESLNSGIKADDVARTLVESASSILALDDDVCPEDLERGFETRWMKRKRDLASGCRRKYSLGLVSLDDSLGGGIQTNEIMIIAGYPGVGKSRLADTLSINLFELGANVLKVTTENTKEQSVERAESMYFDLDYEDVKRCSSVVPVKKIAGNKKRANRHLTIRLTQDKYTLSDFFAVVKMMELKDKFKPDVVVFDSPDFVLLTPSPGLRGGVEKKHDLITRMYSRLKGWIESSNRCLITTSHVKLADYKGRRSKRKDQLDLGDLSDSSGKVRQADIVLTLNVNPETADLGQAELYLAKVRDSPKKKLSIIIHNPYGVPRFKELDSYDT